MYLKQKPEELDKLIEIAKIQSTEASNEIEGIRTTNTRLKQLVADKTTPRNRDEEEIMGYRDVLNTIHENYEYIPDPGELYSATPPRFVSIFGERNRRPLQKYAKLY